MSRRGQGWSGLKDTGSCIPADNFLLFFYLGLIRKQEKMKKKTVAHLCSALMLPGIPEIFQCSSGRGNSSPDLEAEVGQLVKLCNGKS